MSSIEVMSLMSWRKFAKKKKKFDFGPQFSVNWNGKNL